MRTLDASNTWNVSQWLMDNQTPGGKGKRQTREVSSGSKWVWLCPACLFLIWISRGGLLIKSVDVMRVEGYLIHLTED